MLLWICDESEISSDCNKITQSSLLSDFSVDIIDAPPTTLNILRQYLTRDTWMAVTQRGTCPSYITFMFVCLYGIWLGGLFTFFSFSFLS